MEVDGGNDLLIRVARGQGVDEADWPTLRDDMIERLDKIAHNEFPIPNLPPPRCPQPISEPRVSPLPSSPLDNDKENAPVERIPATQHLEPGELPKQINDMLTEIITHLQSFKVNPPHTIQRVAELILQPRAHYKALASYLHAVDRVVQVTSGTNTYPLPLTVPDMSAMHLNGEESRDPAVAVAWTNPTTAALGTDEALGGALLTPIPWLTRRSPEGNGEGHGAQIHSESTETIDGPNGMGSIETVSVSVNGIPSTGHARAITQGELLRQEQRAGVVPVSQLSRGQEPLHDDHMAHTVREDDEAEDDEEETPHARGPEEIGVGDTGPQNATTSHIGEGGLEMQDIDVEAAVGRKHADDEFKGHENAEDGRRERSPSTESSSTKREADEEPEGEPAKKMIKEDDEPTSELDGESYVTAMDGARVPDRTRGTKPDEADDKMETDK